MSKTAHLPQKQSGIDQKDLILRQNDVKITFM